MLKESIDFAERRPFQTIAVGLAVMVVAVIWIFTVAKPNGSTRWESTIF